MEVETIKLKNSNGLSAKFSSYGARWLSMEVPDRYGNFDDVLLGFNDISTYGKAEEKYYGAMVGRVCGRISNACFSLDNKSFKLSQNENGKNHLHGGRNAFHNCYWKSNTGINDQGDSFVEFIHYSPNGDQGYPGNLRVTVRYTLNNNNILSMVCKGITDEDTIINLTNHAFFNLCGSRKPDNILNHHLLLNSSFIIECDDELLPTGKLLSIKGTSLDFMKGRKISESLVTDLYGISINKGYSLAYKLDNADCNLRLASILSEKKSGRKLKIYTNQPSIQVYNGYCMSGQDIGKGGFPYFPSSGIALETQGFPDAIHHSSFPSIILRKDEVYIHFTEYRWSVD